MSGRDGGLWVACVVPGGVQTGLPPAVYLRGERLTARLGVLAEFHRTQQLPLIPAQDVSQFPEEAGALLPAALRSPSSTPLPKCSLAQGPETLPCPPLPSPPLGA